MRPAAAGPLPAALDVCRSLLAYEGEARELITRFKYRNDRAALAWLASGMATLVEPPARVVVTWAPTGAQRRRRRGFDQAELLAAAVARRWGVPCRRLLGRAPGAAQTGLTLAARRQAPSFVPGPAHVPMPVIVVDDVVTTGSTLTASAWALRAAGAPWVGALTAARTPRTSRTTTVRPSPEPALPLSVSIAPPDVETSLKFPAQLADVQQ
jgi:predicted amidophosphoribosyltransferase